MTEKSKPYNILIQKEFNRTIKFLHSINQGAAVLSYEWVEDCLAQN